MYAGPAILADFKAQGAARLPGRGVCVGVECTTSAAAAHSNHHRKRMLRSLPRSVCRSARSSRAPDSISSAAAGILETRAARSVRPCRSWTAAAASSAQRQPRAIHHVAPLTTTADMKFPLVRPMSSLKSSQWEQEGLPVAPMVSGSEPLPSNLKLAAEAWPTALEGGEGDAEGESGAWSRQCIP